MRECDHEFFKNIKVLANEIGPMTIMKELKISEVKVFKVTRTSPNSVFYKHSYNENFKEATALKKRIPKGTFTIPPCFGHRPGISSKKKEDLLDLCKRSLVPSPYKKVYENLQFSDKPKENMSLSFRSVRVVQVERLKYRGTATFLFTLFHSYGL